MNKDQKNKIAENVEMRMINLPVEMRAEEDSRIIYGYAAIFDSLSEPIYWFREKIDKKAFEAADLNDVVAVLNHDNNIIYARSSAKTLSLEVDEKGLRYEFEAPNTTAGNDLLENVRLGNINKSSFAFTVAKASWEEFEDDENKDVEELRTIMEIKKVYDVSPVIRPAYSESSVGKRSAESFKEERDAIMEPQNKNNDDENHSDDKILRSKLSRSISIRQNECNM